MTSPVPAADSAAHTAAAFRTRLALGAVHLTVADLERSAEYYRQAIGLRVLARAEDTLTLGTDTPLLRLRGEPGASPSQPRHTGLYHFALLLPGRAELGRFVSHLIADRVAVQGASDHYVSEAIYFQDPDGHGIEVYADTDPAGWSWQGGQVRMGTVAADIAGIVAAAGDLPAWSGLPAGTVMGHVHLRVSELERSRAFYHGLLGLEVVVDMARQGALFVAADGYHHHFGLNTWESRGGTPAAAGEARLEAVELWLPDTEITRVRAALEAGGVALTDVPGGFEVSDPAGNRLRFGIRG